MSDQNESYPSGWTRVEILSDRAIVTCRPGRHSADGLRHRVLSVLDVEAVRLGHCTSGHVPLSFVYHVSLSGTAVFNYRGEPRNSTAASRAPAVHRTAQVAAQCGGPRPPEAVCVVFPLCRTAAGMEISGPETYSGDRQVALRRDDATAAVKRRSATNQRIDGLTPHQCLQAFTAAQRDQRTFETWLPAAWLRVGDVISIDIPAPECIAAATVTQFNDLGSRVLLGLRTCTRVWPEERNAAEVFKVARSTALTPAQRDCARRMWSCLLRHDVGVSNARAAARAPSVAIADEGLEIEALAADVRP